MDISWVILARGIRIAGGLLDIEGIFQDVKAPPYSADLVVVAKVAVSPLEVGETKTLTLEISDSQGSLVKKLDYEYPVTDLSDWARYTPFVTIALTDLEFPSTGEYSFNLLVDNEFKNREWLTIKDAKEDDYA